MQTDLVGAHGQFECALRSRIARKVHQQSRRLAGQPTLEALVDVQRLRGMFAAREHVGERLIRPRRFGIRQRLREVLIQQRGKIRKPQLVIPLSGESLELLSDGRGVDRQDL